MRLATIVSFALLFLLPFPSQAQQPAQHSAERLDQLPHRATRMQPGPDRPRLAPVLSKEQIAQALAPAERERLHPYFRAVVAEERLGLRRSPDMKAQHHQIGLTVQESGEVLHDAIVYTTDPAAVERTGTEVNARFEGFVTARFTAEELAAVARLGAVSYVDPGAVDYPANDMSVAATGAHLLHEGFIDNTPYEGAIAIVCVYDSGIDFRHEDFIDEEGQSRILALWDQTLSLQAGERRPNGFTYGVEYTQSDLNDEIDGTPADFVRQEDINGHGTHVAGTAAGSGSAYRGLYRGMAPRADLVIVKGGDDTFSRARIIDGVAYCGQKAQDEGKPVVVNLSLGGHAGPHDGTEAYEQAIDQFNQTAGQVVVTSAGNSGTAPMHIGGTVPVGETFAVQFEMPKGYTPSSGAEDDYFFFDGWFDGAPEVTVTVTSPPVYDTDDDMAPDSSVSATYEVGDVGNLPADTAGTVFVAHAPAPPLGNGDLRTELHIFDADASKPPLAGTWTLAFENNGSSPAFFDGWLYDSSSSLSDVALVGGDTDMTVSMPGTSQSVITVGNYITRQVWPASDGRTFGSTDRPVGQIHASSSRGPTRDGRTKPDLAAPGAFIVSSKAEAVSVEDNPLVVRGERHHAMTGTSMAAPHVTGALALVLAERPQMTAAELKALVQGTTVQDSFTGTAANNTYGAGKLNAFGSMVEALGGSQAVRDLYSYAGDGAFFISASGNGRRYAMQFTPGESGIFSGFALDIAWQSSDNPRVEGDGDLLYALYDDDDGLPGEPLTTVLRKSLTEIPPSSAVHFSMLGALPENLQVEANRDYHIVFFFGESDAAVDFRADDGSGGGTNRSAVYMPASSTWRESGDVYTNPIEFRVTAEVTRIEGLTALPVELVAFNASRDGEEAVLQWQTASELRNAGFGVEHATGDRPFEEVRFVEGAGTTSEPQHYEVRLEGLAVGTHRFRLRQVDLDGTAHHSSETSVHIGILGRYELLPTYPNPFSQQAHLQLGVAEEQDVRIEVFDVLGRRVRALHEGPLEPERMHRFTLEAQGLSSGTYFVRITGERFSDLQQVLLVR